MFEDFINYHYHKIAQTYSSKPPTSFDRSYNIYQLGKWLQNNSLEQFKK